MVTKTKTTIEKLNQTAKQAGFLLMTAVATLGMLDLPGGHTDKRIVLPSRPNFAFANVNANGEDQNPLRRERDEVTPHYISYSVVQRTVARAGKQ